MVLGLLPTLYMYTHSAYRVIVRRTENGQCAIPVTNVFSGLWGDTCFACISGGLSLTATFPSFDFKRKRLYLIVLLHVPSESARSADQIKFLEQNNRLHRSINLHDAGQRFQLVVPWSIRPY